MCVAVYAYQWLEASREVEGPAAPLARAFKHWHLQLRIIEEEHAAATAAAAAGRVALACARRWLAA